MKLEGMDHYGDTCVRFGQVDPQKQGGRLTGVGRIFFPDNGQLVEGQFIGNDLNGYGQKVWHNGKHDIGFFLNGLMQGEGKRTEVDGKVYEGKWVRDKF